MKFGLDYDLTYTETPDLWNEFIASAISKGHEVHIVTFRSPETPIEHELDIPVHYTNSTPKRKFMNQKGIVIDVWIDDWPDLIVG